MEEKRALRWQPDDHHFWSLIMLAVTAGGFLLVTWVATKAVFFFLQEAPPLNSDWQRHVLASSGYLELGMLDDAAMVLEEITLAHKTRSEVLGARVGIYLAKKWAGRAFTSLSGL